MELSELERSKKLLQMKGIDTEEVEAENPLERSMVILELERKRRSQPVEVASDFLDVDLGWNIDGTLDFMRVNRENNSFELVFIWNANKTISKIIKR